MSAAQQQVQHGQNVPVVEHDPFGKFKALVPRLKDSLSKLMEVAAIAFYQNSQNDNCIKPAEATIERFDKCLEEFYAICDQMELFLKLAQECHSLSQDSARHTPQPVFIPQLQQPQPPDSQLFSQYLHTVKTQISCAKEIHDLLLDCARRLTDRQVQGQGVPPAQAQQ